MPPKPLALDNISEENRGSLGLEVRRGGEWEDVTIIEDLEAGAEQMPKEEEISEEESSRSCEQEYEASAEDRKFLSEYEVSVLFCSFCFMFSVFPVFKVFSDVERICINCSYVF